MGKFPEGKRTALAEALYQLGPVTEPGRGPAPQKISALEAEPDKLNADREAVAEKPEPGWTKVNPQGIIQIRN